MLQPIPTKDDATSLANQLAELYDSKHRDGYETAVASAAGMAKNDLHFNEHEKVITRWEEDADTTIIDYPLLRSLRKPFFETRICIAICSGKMSTKFWSRTCLPIGIESSNSVSVDEVKNLVKTFRCITDSSLTWMKKTLNKPIKEYFQPKQFVYWGQLEVSALGIADEGLAECFRKLWDVESTAKDILKDEDVDERLTYYFKQVSRIQGKLSQYSNGRNLNNHFWFKVPAWVEVKDGYIKPREVLYLLRPLDDIGQAIGLAYDDSLNGDLLLRSGAKAANIMGRWL